MNPDFPVGRYHEDLSAFAKRRASLLTQLEAAGGGALLLPTAPERIRNGGTAYPYRFDSDFYYLTGYLEPDAWLLLRTHESPRSVLFCRDRDPEKELWEGRRLGVAAVPQALGLEAAFPLAELDAKLPELLAGAPALWLPLAENEEIDARLRRLLAALRTKARLGPPAPDTLHDARALIARMRRVKDAFELELMQRSATIAAHAHRRAMRVCRPGLHEYALEAELIAEFRRHGAQGPSYPSIVAGGANACILHYTDNRARLQAGELVLIDAGCEYDGYASDITRTFPVDGRFRPPQRLLYDLVLAAQEAAIAAIRPGATFDEPHQTAVRVLTQGLLDLGLLSGSLDEALERQTYKRFYMHRTGHWLGLDVHDAGPTHENGQPVTLVPGMVLTVEPGLYVPEADDVPRDFWNLGIRIEDDALVTEKGCRLLTRDVPVAAEAIEALMQHGGSDAR